MTEFENLSSITPSLHFNPNVVQVVQPYTNIPFPRQHLARPSPQFFRLGPAMGGSWSLQRWAGAIPTPGELNNSDHPFLDNENGVIGMHLRGPSMSSPPLHGTQVIYYVDFLIVGAGNPEIRLSQHTDQHHDDLVYDGHAIYNVVITWPLTPPETFVHETAPQLHAFGPEVFTRNGQQRVERLADIQSGEEIFATFDGTGRNIPSTARLIIAVFDNGRFYNFDIGGGDSTNYVAMPENIQTSEIKVFLWRDLGTMQPMYWKTIDR